MKERGNIGKPEVYMGRYIAYSIIEEKVVKVENGLRMGQK